jgi:regulatory protein
LFRRISIFDFSTFPRMSLFDEKPTESVISEIRPLPSDPNLRRVRVGRKTIATLRVADIESLGLAVEMPWTASLAKKVQHALAADRARRDALKILGRRACSRNEIIERLSAKKHVRGLAVEVAQELIAAGWIDDAAFAEAVVHQATRTKPAGRRLLNERLLGRQIDRSVAEKAVAAHESTRDDVQAALGLARKRLATMSSLPVATIQRRFRSLLARRGFDDDTIETVMDRLHLPVRDRDE